MIKFTKKMKKMDQMMIKIKKKMQIMDQMMIKFKKKMKIMDQMMIEFYRIFIVYKIRFHNELHIIVIHFLIINKIKLLKIK